MFKKPFRTKTQTVMKGSDRKKLRAELMKSFRDLSAAQASEIIPNKEEVAVVKICTHTGDNVFIYCVNKLPVLFEVDKEKVLYPSVYLLWRYPDLLERFTTWAPVFSKLAEGADLMLPGLVVRETVTPSTFKHLQKGQTCSISIAGNRAPVGVGFTLMSGSDFFDSGMRGKGIRSLHLLGDELWSFGDRSTPPDLGDDPFPQEEDELEEGDITPQTQEGEVTPPGAGGSVELSGSTVPDIDGLSISNDMVSNEGGACSDPDNRDGGSGQSQNGATSMPDSSCDITDQSDETGLQSCDNINQSDISVTTTPEQMDELLHFCFLCALKSSVKKSDLPLVTGTFYKSHMMKFCPADKQLDIKKSTFKKLSKFLQKQEKTGIIKTKELSKGVESLMEINKSHELLRGFEAAEPTVQEVADTDAGYNPPQITEMFAVTSSVLPLFKPQGYGKGSALKSADIRRVVTDYVKDNELQDENSKGFVRLDPILAEISLTRAEGDKATLRWDELFSRITDKMSTVHEIIFAGQPPVIRKGNLEPIKLVVERRTSNKHVTTVENLDLFGIDPREFGHTVQVRVACSASVAPHPQKNKGPQVIVQGNQIHFIEDLLTNTYRIPKKYLKGTEKAPKKRR